MCRIHGRDAQESLRRDLGGEVAFLACHDTVLRQVNARSDVPGSRLSQLITLAYQQGGVLSKNRRKQFVLQVPAPVFDYIEACVQSALLVADAAQPSTQGPDT